MISSFWDSKTARVLSTTLIFALAIVFAHGARETLTLFLFSVLFAYFVAPLVGLLSRILHGRVKAIAATYLLLAAVMASIAFLLGPRIADEGKSLMGSVPVLADRAASGQFIFRMGQSHGWSHERAVQIQHYFISHRSQIIAYGEGLAEKLEAPLSHIWWLILIPILSFFFLKDAAFMATGVVRLGKSDEHRVVLQGIIDDVNVMLGSYIRAQMILSALTAIVLTLVLALMHVPYAFILGPLAGVCEFIPVVGPAIACATIFGLAGILGYDHLLWLFLFLGTWRTIQDYVNAPRIMGTSLEILPLIEIFAVLAGGEVGGVVGALVAVPLLAILRILFTRLSVTGTVDAPVTSASATALPDLLREEN